VKGEIFGKSDLLLDGSIEGLVQLQEGQLTIGTTAEITADIIADSVVVCGNVKGNVKAGLVKTTLERRGVGRPH
jgi:cytoskeletal protein CcmA (bactofilin family)